jgi:hypothetical protein
MSGRRIILYLIALLITTNVFSQKIEYGGGIGLLTARGDISPEYNPAQIGAGMHGMYRRHISNAIALRGNVMGGYYSLNSSLNPNVFQQERYQKTTGSLYEVAAISEYKFFNPGKLIKQPELIPYVFGGLGYMFATNKVNDVFTGTKNRDYLGTIVLPYGFGVKYRYKGPWSVTAEMGSRFTFTDRLDRSIFYNSTGLGASNTAVYATTASNNALRKNAGNTSTKDQYIYLNFTLSYTIFNIICPNTEKN